MITIDKVTIAAGKMTPMRDFYARTFSADFQPVEMYERTLYQGRIGEIEFLICPKDLARVEADVNTLQLRFVVDDVQAVFDLGVDNGGTILTEVQEIDGRLHAALRDPDGNSLELVQRQEGQSVASAQVQNLAKNI